MDGKLTPVERPERLNPNLFTSDGKAKSFLSTVPPLVESALGPNVRIFVVGSQTNGKFRTREDCKRIQMLRSKKCREINSEDLEFLSVLRGVTLEEMKETFESRITEDKLDKGGYIFINQLSIKLMLAGISDLDLRFVFESEEEMTTAYKNHEFHLVLEGVRESIEDFGMTLDVLMTLGAGNVRMFEIKTDSWFEGRGFYSREKILLEDGAF
jgi:hypothetical protein